jgi:thiosulfate/3-mercaptopyruvate sulfurtransferase
LAELLLAGERLCLLDVRWSLTGPPGRRAYEAGHLPGAVFVDLDTELAGSAGPRGRHPLPDPDVFGAAMRRAGVTRADPVVGYDQRDSTAAAARLWWLLVHHGHPDVRVLDGGVDGWLTAGNPLSVSPAHQREGDFVASPGRLPVLDAEGAAALAREGVLIDARAPARYRGEQEPVDPVAGHIPGALNAPATELVAPDGRFLPAAELTRRFAALGADGRVPVGAYCGSGVTAAHTVLAAHLAGVEAALYPGSWSAWVSDLSRPVATGDRPG